MEYEMAMASLLMLDQTVYAQCGERRGRIKEIIKVSDCRRFVIEWADGCADSVLPASKIRTLRNGEPKPCRVKAKRCCAIRKTPVVKVKRPERKPATPGRQVRWSESSDTVTLQFFDEDGRESVTYTDLDQAIRDYGDFRNDKLSVLDVRIRRL